MRRPPDDGRAPGTDSPRSVTSPLVSTPAGPSGGNGVAFRAAASLAGGVVIALLGGLILAEYTFQGEGIQWLAIFGGAGLGAVMAWILNRTWRSAPPPWLAPVAAVLALAGEAMAVQRDTASGDPWPAEGWAAVALAAVAAGYGVYSASRTAPS